LAEWQQLVDHLEWDRRRLGSEVRHELGQLAGDRPPLDCHLQWWRYAHTDEHPNQHSDSDQYTHTDKHADEYPGAANEYTHQHTDQHSDADRDQHTCATNGYAHTDEHADRYPGAADEYTHQHADQHSDADRHSDSDQYTYADEHTDRHAGAANEYTHQYPDEHSDTDQHPDTGYARACDRYPPGLKLKRRCQSERNVTGEYVIHAVGRHCIIDHIELYGAAFQQC
jgi:hypothetical protein